MADFVFTTALGRVRTYADLAGGSNDQFLILLLKASGLEADSTLRDYTTVAAILAAANDECDFTGYSRKTLSGVSNTAIDTTNNRADTAASNPSAYTNSGVSSQAAGKAIICYDPDTTGGSDSDLIPLLAFDCALTFEVGVATSLAFNASGIYRAAAA